MKLFLKSSYNRYNKHPLPLARRVSHDDHYVDEHGTTHFVRVILGLHEGQVTLLRYSPGNHGYEQRVDEEIAFVAQMEKIVNNEIQELQKGPRPS
ncbi:MAG: hypothetical protein ISS48_04305 [Candidatus Aenigmarchaeota archaeon]|nr:hypothetical protein [Candidatus Aenigmarchaeota archaeon]